MKSTVIQILQSTVIIMVTDWHQSCRYLTVKVTYFFKSVGVHCLYNKKVSGVTSDGVIDLWGRSLFSYYRRSYSVSDKERQYKLCELGNASQVKRAVTVSQNFPRRHSVVEG